MGRVLVRVFAGKAYIRQGSITQIVKSIRKSSTRGCGLRSGCRRFPAAGKSSALRRHLEVGRVWGVSWCVYLQEKPTYVRAL